MNKDSTVKQRVYNFMGTVNQGGDPITALALRAPFPSQQQAIEAHQVRAQRSIDDSMARLRS